MTLPSPQLALKENVREDLAAIRELLSILVMLAVAGVLWLAARSVTGG